MERRSSDGSFLSNISQGGTGTPFAMPPDLRRLAERVARILDLDVAGVDVLLDGEHYLICEANSSPGSQGLEKACGISARPCGDGSVACFSGNHESGKG